VRYRFFLKQLGNDMARGRRSHSKKAAMLALGVRRDKAALSSG
jgi:hypothetical protein